MSSTAAWHFSPDRIVRLPFVPRVCGNSFRACCCALGLLLSLAGASNAVAAGSQQVRGVRPDIVGRLNPIGPTDPSYRLEMAIGLPLRNQA